MKTFLIFFKTGFLVTFFFSQVNAQLTGWNNIGGNSKKNGNVSVTAPATDSILWETATTGYFGAPIYIEGNYMVTMRFNSTTNAPIVCYDLTTGNVLWNLDVTGSTGRSLPVGLRDSRLYVIRYTESMNDSLFALDVADGSRLWTSNVNVASYISESGVFDSLGNFYLMGNMKTYKLNPTNGTMIWQTTTVPMASGSGEMAINNANYTGYTLETLGGLSHVWAINLNTGVKKYSCLVPDLQPGGNLPQSALMVGNDGKIYVQLTEDNVAALRDDGTGLTLLWQTQIYGNSAFSTMCVGNDGTVYAPSDGKIVRLDPITGNILNTSVSITQGGFFTPRLSSTNYSVVYASNGENRVYAFDPSLNILWFDTLTYTNNSGMCIAPDGRIAVSGNDKVRVYAVENTTGTGVESKNATIKVFPNPTTSYVEIILAESKANVTSRFVLSNSEGKLVLSGEILRQKRLDLSLLNPGLYFIRIAGQTRSYAIVKSE